MKKTHGIKIKGAREHNLKNIDVEIPRDKLVVITGLSGSGKSSLAFDTLYAEGQRRYVESLSAYARQFLDQMHKPDVDSIEGLSPAISIEQKTGSRNPRSTVGTATEIYDYLRLLWARVGTVHCWNCGQPIASQTIQQMVDRVLEFPEGERFSVLAPVVREKKGDFADVLAKLRQDGFVRANIDGDLHELAEPPALAKTAAHTIEVFVDRLVKKDGIRQRLTDSIELAAKLAEGVVKVSPLEGDDLLFSEKFACTTCGISYPEITPRLFSFNNPAGACPTCDGIGAKMFFDPDLIVPDEELSIKEGAIEPWERRNNVFFHQILDAVCTKFEIDQYAPWNKLPEKAKKLLLEGKEGEEVELTFEKNGRKHSFKREFEGVLANLRRRFEEHERRRREQGRISEEDFEAIYDEFHRYMSQTVCEDCGGARLRKEARFVKVGGKSITEMTALTIREAHDFLKGLVAVAEAEGDRRADPARGRRSPVVPQQRRRRLPVARSHRRHAVGRRVAAHPAGHPDRQLAGRRPLHPRRAVDRPAPAGQRAPPGGAHPAARPRQQRHRRRARRGDHPRRRPRHRHGPARRRGRRPHRRRRHARGHRRQHPVADRRLSLGAQGDRGAAPAPPVGRPRADRPARARPQPARPDASAFPIGVLTCVTGVSGSGKSTLVIDTLLRALAQQAPPRQGAARAARRRSTACSTSTR